MTDAHGIPLVAHLTAANRNDITELLPLVEKVDADQAAQIGADLSGLRAFVADIYSQEQGGKRPDGAQIPCPHGSGSGCHLTFRRFNTSHSTAAKAAKLHH